MKAVCLPSVYRFVVCVAGVLLLLSASVGCTKPDDTSASAKQQVAAGPGDATGLADQPTQPPAQNPPPIEPPPAAPVAAGNTNGDQGVQAAEGPGETAIQPVPDFVVNLGLGLPEENSSVALLDYIDRNNAALQQVVQTGANMTQDELKQRIKTISKFKLEASEKLLGLEDLPPETLKIAKQAKLEALSQMAGLEDTVAATALEAYADELAKSEDPRLHFNGKVVKVGFLIERLIGGQLKDPEPLESAVTELTRVPALIDLPSAMTLYQVYLRLEQYGYDGSSRKVREQIVAALKQNGAPQLQEIAATLEQNKRFDELGRVLRSVLAGQTTTTAEIKNAALKVAQELPDANTFNYLNSNALQFEAKEKYEVADLLYDVIAATVMKSGPPEVAKEADAVVRARDQRKLIIGKPITIQGLDLDRINVDWNGYQGKPVIVPFWSLRADTFIMFQKLHELMDRHGDKIKVLGVNLDGDEQPVLPFVTQARVRFPSIRQTDPNLQGVRDPLAQQVGVASQPYVLLVDAKGNVSSIVLELDRLDAAVDTLIK